MTPYLEMMDKLQKELKYALKSIPSGGGGYGAYGIDQNADDAARIIRQMVDLAARK